ncbi:MAG: hypothetical protein DMD89_30390 [Candidatus Rokuibacteriota bacterium]|nr:MAG: hypothetical protein DMD89_30390 [Candidatus Rokubacteria bacterium]
MTLILVWAAWPVSSGSSARRLVSDLPPETVQHLAGIFRDAQSDADLENEAKRIARVYPAVDVRLPPSGWTIAPGDTTPEDALRRKAEGAVERIVELLTKR